MHPPPPRVVEPPAYESIVDNQTLANITNRATNLFADVEHAEAETLVLNNYAASLERIKDRRWALDRFRDKTLKPEEATYRETREFFDTISFSKLEACIEKIEPRKWSTCWTEIHRAIHWYNSTHCATQSTPSYSAGVHGYGEHPTTHISGTKKDIMDIFRAYYPPMRLDVKNTGSTENSTTAHERLIKAKFLQKFPEYEQFWRALDELYKALIQAVEDSCNEVYWLSLFYGPRSIFSIIHPTKSGRNAGFIEKVKAQFQTEWLQEFFLSVIELGIMETAEKKYRPYFHDPGRHDFLGIRAQDRCSNSGATAKRFRVLVEPQDPSSSRYRYGRNPAEVIEYPPDPVPPRSPQNANPAVTSFPSRHNPILHQHNSMFHEYHPIPHKHNSMLSEYDPMHPEHESTFSKFNPKLIQHDSTLIVSEFPYKDGEAYVAEYSKRECVVYVYDAMRTHADPQKIKIVEFTYFNDEGSQRLFEVQAWVEEPEPTRWLNESSFFECSLSARPVHGVGDRGKGLVNAHRHGHMLAYRQKLV